MGNYPLLLYNGVIIRKQTGNFFRGKALAITTLIINFVAYLDYKSL